MDTIIRQNLYKLLRDKTDRAVLKRGEELYRTGKVIDYKIQFADYSIQFKVLGSAGYYIVEIDSFNDEQYIKTFCSCPYDWGGICKHRVAAIFFILNNLNDLDLRQPGESRKKKNISNTKKRKSTEPYLVKSLYPLSNQLIEEHVDKNDLFPKDYQVEVEIGDIDSKSRHINFHVFNYGFFLNNHYNETVSIIPKGSKISIICSCGENVTKLCKHVCYVFEFLIQEFDSADFFKLMNKDDYEKEKNRIIDETGISKAMFDKSIGFALINNKLRISLKDNLRGLIPQKKYRDSKLTESLAEITAKETDLAILDRIDDNIDEKIFETGFVIMVRGMSEMAMVQIEPICAKPNKNKTNLISKFEFYNNCYSKEKIRTSEDQHDIFTKCYELRESYIHDFIGDAGSNFGENDEIQKYIYKKLLDIFPLLAKQEFLYFKYADYGFDRIAKSELKRIRVSEEKVKLFFEVFEHDDIIGLKAKLKTEKHIVDVLDLNSRESVPSFLFVNIKGCLYLHESLNQAKTFSKILGSPQFVGTSLEKENFINDIVMPIAENYNVDMSKVKSMKKKKIKLKLKEKAIFVSELSNFVLFKPVVKYNQEIEADLLDDKNIIKNNNGVIHEYIRDKDEEEKFNDILNSLHPDFKSMYRKDFYHLKFEQMIENYWFFDAYEKMKTENIKVYGLNDLKRFKYSPYKAKVAISVKSDQDWFDVEANVSFGDFTISLDRVKKSVLKKNRFIQLDDGSTGILPQKWLDKFEKYFRTGELKNDKLKISKLKFSIVEQLFENLEDENLLQELAEKRSKLKEFKQIKNIRKPKEIKAKLRDYQKEGYKWLNFLDEFQWGGILADDMGLGKTLQVLTFLQKKIKTSKRANLIVVPATLLFNWQNEIEKFAPSLKVMEHYGNTRDKDHKSFKNYDLVITTYGLAVNDVELLRKYTFNYVVLDESQAIKNPHSKRYKAVCLLKGKNKITLTGTPIENNTFDLYAQMNFLNPGFLGSQKSFKENYSDPIDKKKDFSRAQELRKIINPFVLRRTKEQVEKELPSKTENVIYCMMEKEQREVYEAFRNKYRSMILDKISEEGLGKSKMRVIEGLTKLRQICDSPALLAEKEDYGDNSIKTQEIIRHILNKTQKHKILVFSQFVKMLEVIKNELDNEDISYEYLDGQCKRDERKTSVENFQENENCRVFLISLKAGGQGLNLTAADYVYLVDPWWNPAAEMQAIDRCYRIGQTKKVFAYRMICKDTVEEKIMDIQNKKKSVSNEIIKTDDSFVKSLDKKAIENLFSV